MKKQILTSLVCATVALTACESLQNRGNKELIGAGSGALIGGVLGSKVGGGSGEKWATGAGVLIGALVGSEIGKSLDNADRAYAQDANVQAQRAPLGQPVRWNNPQSGNYGTVTPVRDGYTDAGAYCREFQQTIVVDGRQQSAFGTACRQPDGSWKIVS